MHTKPQDVVVALKLSLVPVQRSYADLARELGMSASEVHAAVQRLGKARLLDPETKEVRREALRNFLVHGVPYAFPAHPHEVTRGMLTAWAAPVLSGKIVRPKTTRPFGQIRRVGCKESPCFLSSGVYRMRRERIPHFMISSPWSMP